MNIPKSFNLYSHTIKVSIDNKRMNEMNCYGVALLGKNEIVISKIDNDNIDLPETQILQTFYHEKVHQILFMMNEKELYSNDRFVDNLANLLLQSDLTAKYKNNPK